MRQRKAREINKCYAPYKTLTKLLEGFESLERKYEKLEDRKNEGPSLFDKDKKALDKELRSLKRKKYDALNVHIFRAMANLTYLLEKMHDDPFIRENFKVEVKELFFGQRLIKKAYEIKEKGPKKGKIQPAVFALPIFTRFIQAICTDMPLLDFRLIVCDIMQESIFYGLQQLAATKFYDKFGDLTFSSNMMVPDIGRARSWTTLLSLEAYKYYMPLDKRTRPPLF